MSQRYEDESGEPKRRRLDELFADEPFLSPTMKARRLHEKLNGHAAGQSIPPPPKGLPEEAFVRTEPRREPQHTEELAIPQAVTADLGATPVSLVDAAIFLRSKGQHAPRTLSSASQRSLMAFRDSTLTVWLRAIEER